MEAAVLVNDVSREFLTAERRTLFRFLRGRPKDPGSPGRRLLALQHIQVSIAPGERIAVIGNNAAGKTTLLKIIAGLLRPTSGSVQVRGDMTLLTALGIGM